jgi:hypothetical protein
VRQFGRWSPASQSDYGFPGQCADAEKDLPAKNAKACDSRRQINGYFSSSLCNCSRSTKIILSRLFACFAGVSVPAFLVERKFFKVLRRAGAIDNDAATTPLEFNSTAYRRHNCYASRASRAAGPRDGAPLTSRSESRRKN